MGFSFLIYVHLFIADCIINPEGLSGKIKKLDFEAALTFTICTAGKGKGKTV